MTSLRTLFQWLWPLPRFGWESLSFTDKLKLFAFYIQAGAGIAMTGFAGYALWKLATLNAIWPIFYLGAMALVMVGIVITGLASLLIKRTVEAEIGPVKFKTSDAATAEMMTRMATPSWDQDQKVEEDRSTGPPD